MRPYHEVVVPRGYLSDEQRHDFLPKVRRMAALNGYTGRLSLGATYRPGPPRTGAPGGIYIAIRIYPKGHRHA